MTNETSQLRLGPTNEVVSKKPKIVRPYIDVNEIRNAYPNPQRFQDGWGLWNSYCVGGAFQRFIGKEDDRCKKWVSLVGFPNEAELTKWFMEFGIPDADAFLKAERLMSDNDSGDFEGAWQALKEALEYGCDTGEETR